MKKLSPDSFIDFLVQKYYFVQIKLALVFSNLLGHSQSVKHKTLVQYFFLIQIFLAKTITFIKVCTIILKLLRGICIRF